MKLKDLFLLDFRKFLMIGILFIIFAQLHNIACVITKCTQPGLVLAVLLIALYFALVLLYSLYYLFLKKFD